ncbi:uncharacterized protein LOC111322232 [Stylophora pistillata]|uniref:uncharacterized protein LOC111322232 n=1 Tax=Stylophora pistillata TaxID=50429 RepID=UPI000C042F9C|nr:uncharacterized protein LOC111322232 [Stylophora pistillata]
MSGKTSHTALSAAISQGILGSPSLIYKPGKPKHAGLFYDLDEFESGLNRAEEAFGEDFLHAIAIKANPVSAMLKIILEKGHGLECASITEVLHGMDLGFPPEKIVFDSPVKTEPELKFALENGIHINVDNYQELERITAIIKDQGQTKSSVGIRLKPILGVGAVKDLSTCTTDSKFGVQLTASSKEEIISWYMDHPWLTGVHIHIGSQSFDCGDLTRGVKCVVDFALEVNKRLGKKQISIIDIGGGLPANLEDDTTRPSFQDYAQALKKEVPELFPSYGTFKKVITEFGQAFNAKAGWLASRVEYTKKASDDLRIALIHFGADMMMRTCYCPNIQKYQRRVEVFSKEGQLKEGERMRYNIAGPLCFSGDVVKRDVLLPTVEEGDYLILHDCGANSLSLFSRHCSRQAPAVFGYRMLEDGSVSFEVLKEAETVDDLLVFWKGRKM